MLRRIGKFSIERSLLEDSPEVVQRIMGRVIVVRCETYYESDTLEYTAISSEFREVVKGSEAPRYIIIIDKDVVGNNRFVGFG